eukprot:1184917-Prorocentrum_minimum.AAC.4
MNARLLAGDDSREKRELAKLGVFDSATHPTLVVLEYTVVRRTPELVVNVQQLRVMFDLEFVYAVASFFVPGVDGASDAVEKILPLDVNFDQHTGGCAKPRNRPTHRLPHRLPLRRPHRRAHRLVFGYVVGRAWLRITTNALKRVRREGGRGSLHHPPGVGGRVPPAPQGQGVRLRRAGAPPGAAAAARRAAGAPPNAAGVRRGGRSAPPQERHYGPAAAASVHAAGAKRELPGGRGGRGGPRGPAELFDRGRALQGKQGSFFKRWHPSAPGRGDKLPREQAHGAAGARGGPGAGPERGHAERAGGVGGGEGAAVSARAPQGGGDVQPAAGTAPVRASSGAFLQT